MVIRQCLCDAVMSLMEECGLTISTFVSRAGVNRDHLFAIINDGGGDLTIEDIETILSKFNVICHVSVENNIFEDLENF